jgi:hypothetical protein
MSINKNIVETFQFLLKELDINGPNARWKVLRQGGNLMLRSAELQLKYQKLGGNAGLTEKDRENIKAAIELRREIYRKIKARKSG